MKKIWSLMLSVLMLFTLASGALAEGSTPMPLAGGWSRAESPVVTDDLRTLADQAMENLAEADFTPVAYIGSQVVAGTNYCLLFRFVPVEPDAVSGYALATIFKDLDGSAHVLDFYECDAEEGLPDLLGSWTPAGNPTVTDAARAAVEKAVKASGEAEVSPVALLATQLVSGTNYALLCEISSSPLSPESSYVILHVYEDLSGNAVITDSFGFLPSNG